MFLLIEGTNTLSSITNTLGSSRARRGELWPQLKNIYSVLTWRGSRVGTDYKFAFRWRNPDRVVDVPP